MSGTARGTFRVECKNDDCGWDYEHHLKRFVTEAADNHEKLMRTHPEAHTTTLPRYVDTDTDHSETVGDSEGSVDE